MTISLDPNVRHFVRFVIVGVTQNGAIWALFALEAALGVPLVPAALIAAVGGLALSFTLNRRWTFPGTDDRTKVRAVRFVVVWLGFVFFTIPTLVLLVEVADLPRLAAQALILIVCAPVSFLIQRRWTFGRMDPGTEPPQALARATMSEPTSVPAGSGRSGA